MKRTPFVHICLLIAFIFNSIITVPIVSAQELVLPKPGVMVHLSPPENPAILKGIKVDSNNPFRFEFILDKGDANVDLKEQSTKLIKYFLASLTIPEKDLWVNLSPYEKDRIVPDSFGLTEMGRDLLAQDYMLKQVTASLIYPEDEIGKRFWKKIYEQAAIKYGTTNIPVNTFNKVWIVPEKAVVYENAKAGTAYVVESKLKVMLEQDYLSLAKHASPPAGLSVSSWTPPPGVDPPIQIQPSQPSDTSSLGSQIVREIVIPELTREINEGKNFAQLRQVYNSLILATWYKKKIKDSILSKVYADKNKTQGVNVDNPQDKQKIYEQYLAAFKKGVYNYIKEEAVPGTDERIPRKYFSGGIVGKFGDLAMTIVTQLPDQALTAAQGLSQVIVNMEVSDDEAMISTLFAAPKIKEGEVPFEKTLSAGKEYNDRNVKILFAKLRDAFRQYQQRWNYSNNDKYGISKALGLILENLEQHEDYWFQAPYYRVYRTNQPSQGIRVEFWGRAKHPLPQEFKDEKSGGKEFKWFGKGVALPWTTMHAPESAVTGGWAHTGVSSMFEWLEELAQVGWREDGNGHIIAVHFPTNTEIRDGAMVAELFGEERMVKIADQFRSSLPGYQRPLDTDYLFRLGAQEYGFGRSGRTLYRLGPLMFITFFEDMIGVNGNFPNDKEGIKKLIDQYKYRLGRFYERYKNNIIFVSPFSAIPAASINDHTAATIASMLYQREKIQDATVMDFGAGSGILALVALRLGARQVILIENDEKESTLARLLLSEQGFNEGEHFVIVKENMNKIGNSLDAKVQSNAKRVGIINVGPWGIYGNANQEALELAKTLDLRTVINAGFIQGVDPRDSTNHDQAIEQASSALSGQGYKVEKFAFKPNPQNEGVQLLIAQADRAMKAATIGENIDTDQVKRMDHLIEMAQAVYVVHPNVDDQFQDQIELSNRMIERFGITGKPITLLYNRQRQKESYSSEFDRFRKFEMIDSTMGSFNPGSNVGSSAVFLGGSVVDCVQTAILSIVSRLHEEKKEEFLAYLPSSGLWFDGFKTLEQRLAEIERTGKYGIRTIEELGWGVILQDMFKNLRVTPPVEHSYTRIIIKLNGESYVVHEPTSEKLFDLILDIVRPNELEKRDSAQLSKQDQAMSVREENIAAAVKMLTYLYSASIYGASSTDIVATAHVRDLLTSWGLQGENRFKGDLKRLDPGIEFEPQTNAEDIFAEIPAGSKFLGSGISAIVFKTPGPDPYALRISEGIIPRPKLEALIQPLPGEPLKVITGYQIERLPLLELIKEEELDRAKKDLNVRLRSQGYRLNEAEARTDNIGKLNGKYYVIDPGAVERDQAMTQEEKRIINDLSAVEKEIVYSALERLVYEIKDPEQIHKILKMGFKEKKVFIDLDYKSKYGWGDVILNVKKGIMKSDEIGKLIFSKDWNDQREEVIRWTPLISPDYRGQGLAPMAYLWWATHPTMRKRYPEGMPMMGTSATKQQVKALQRSLVFGITILDEEDSKNYLDYTGRFPSTQDWETGFSPVTSPKKGGIDFNADKMNLQIKNAGKGIEFKIDPAMLKQLQNAPGFTPVIINIQPLQSLPQFLGINEAPAQVVSA